MRLVFVDICPESRSRFYPLVLSRPVWQLRCGISTLGEKIRTRLGIDDVAYFVPDYLADAYREQTDLPVNDPSVLTGEDLLVVDPRIKADDPVLSKDGPAEIALDSDGRVCFARIPAAKAPESAAADIKTLLQWAQANLPAAEVKPSMWGWLWELMLAGPSQITRDFVSAGLSGVVGNIDERAVVIGAGSELFVGPDATVGPLSVIDTTAGPVWIDRDVQVQPLSHIEGPCYIGPKTIIYGAKLRPGNSIGPVCRIGGEVADSVILGYSNKYHDGFLGHAYVGQWVNLGAGTSNSDLKSDYSEVSVVMPGHGSVCTGSLKVGSAIGDHAKTSIGTLLNTGAYVGGFAMILADGGLVPKFMPSFGYLHKGSIRQFDHDRLFATARISMARRDCTWSEAQQSMWESVLAMTDPDRQKAIRAI